MVPAAYVKSSDLAGYMHRQLGTVADVLGWTVPGSYEDTIDETLLAYGVDSIGDATDIRKLRTLARREVWRSVMQATASHIDVQLDGESLDQSQVHTHARQQFQIAADAVDTAGYDDLGTPAAYVASVNYRHDPYDATQDHERKV